MSAVDSLGKYEIRRQLGRGAMGTVYEGFDPVIERIVAIKILPKKMNESRDFVERFYKEGKAAARLSHNNIMQAIDVGLAVLALILEIAQVLAGPFQPALQVLDLLRESACLSPDLAQGLLALDHAGVRIGVA